VVVASVDMWQVGRGLGVWVDRSVDRSVDVVVSALQ
jgi:hypothetical protein